MGNRGFLPALEGVRADPLADLTPPVWLGTYARQHWEQHAEQLARLGLLTSATADAYALCCDLWGRVRLMEGSDTTRSYLDTVKAYTSMAKAFRMLPTEKPTQAPTDRHASKKAFDF